MQTIMRLVNATRESLDLPSANFQPLIFGLGAWTDNLHFAFDLVATMKPRLLVELGTDRGESYFAFCQAVAEGNTATKCFAIDTWRGDHQTGSYDETTFAEVSAHNRAHYSAFSTLLRSSFDEARDRFAPGSIDLLHIDGLHTEAAVRHDLEGWLPKLAPGGILLMHDVGVRTQDFGVWKVWDELRARGRSHTFVSGPGLGVWQKPPAASLPTPLESLFQDAPARAELLRYYRARTEDLQRQIWQSWKDGSIRQTAIANQTTIQIFHTHDGTHTEENSVLARIGHGDWKEVSLSLPPGAGAAPLRIDFYSALTTIDLTLLRVLARDSEIFRAASLGDFEQVLVAGDAARLPSEDGLRVRVTGPDPQLYLPTLSVPAGASLRVELRLRVS